MRAGASSFFLKSYPEFKYNIDRSIFKKKQHFFQVLAFAVLSE